AGDASNSRTVLVAAVDGVGAGFGTAALHVLEAEAALDAEVAAGHTVVHGARDLHDRVVLDVDLPVAPHAAAGGDRGGHRLVVLVPRAGRAHVVLGLEHQRSGRAHADAVAAVDARAVRQRHGELGGDPRVKPAPGHGDGERVLGVRSAGFD